MGHYIQTFVGMGFSYLDWLYAINNIHISHKANKCTGHYMQVSSSQYYFEFTSSLFKPSGRPLQDELLSFLMYVYRLVRGLALK